MFELTSMYKLIALTVSALTICFSNEGWNVTKFIL